MLAGVAGAHDGEVHEEGMTAQLISEVQPATTKEIYDAAVRSGAAFEVVEMEASAGVSAPRDAASGQATGKSVTVTSEVTTTAVSRDAASGQATGKRTPGAAVEVQYHLFDETGDPVSVQAKTVSEVAASETALEVRVTVRGWDADQKEAIAKKVDVVAGKVFGMETALRNVTVEPNSVSVSVERPAKLLGFIPVAYEHAFTIDDKGKVSQGKPWWLIFATNDSVDFTKGVEAAFQHNQSNLDFTKFQDIVERQSQAFQTLSNVLKAAHETAMNAIRNIK